MTTAAGHPRGALLRAYDKATGKDAGTVLMPAQQSGSPMTYMLNGKQYIVVALAAPMYRRAARVQAAGGTDDELGGSRPGLGIGLGIRVPNRESRIPAMILYFFPSSSYAVLTRPSRSRRRDRRRVHSPCISRESCTRRPPGRRSSPPSSRIAPT